MAGERGPGVIEETIQIHDKKQFEIKLGYPFTGEEGAKVYDVETYFFFPNNLGINRYTYTREDFYNSTQIYVRLQTPVVLLRNMAAGKDSPLEKLKDAIEGLFATESAGEDEKSFADYEYQLKMFCCIFKSAVRDHVQFISRKKHDLNSRNTSLRQQDFKDLVDKYLAGINATVTAFRSLRTLVNVPTRNKEIFSVFLFGDEYLSLLIEYYTYGLIQVINRLDFSEKESFNPRLLALIKTELDYRRANNYPSIPSINSTNEEFLFRSSVLKKFMGNVLFLTTKFKHEGELLEQIAFALAAGIAMMFATTAVFFAQAAYSTVSTPLFLVLVISYMFKDRIKEFIRTYLGAKLRTRLFDHKRKIYFNAKQKLGWCRESFVFLKSEKLPRTIVKLRAKDHITEVENDWVGEKVILYRKQVKILNRQFRSIHHDYPVNSIVDIMRLNVSRFLTRMDNSKTPIYVCDSKGCQRIFGNRVYHVNMIMKHSGNGRVVYRRFRLVLNQNGIKRIEEVTIDTN